MHLIFEWEVWQCVAVDVVDVRQNLKRYEVLQAMDSVMALRQHKQIADLCKQTPQHLHNRNQQCNIGS